MNINKYQHYLVLALNLRTEKEDIAAINKMGVEVEEVLTGSYKGVEERSYLIKDDYIRRVVQLMRMYNQESVMMMVFFKSNSYGVIFDKEGAILMSGQIQETSYIPDSEGWTRDQTGTYYTIA